MGGKTPKNNNQKEMNNMTKILHAEIRKEIVQSKATRQRIDRRIAEMREHWI